MEIHSVRIEHGPVQTPTMSYSQRQPQNHRPTNHGQEIYKPSRSPLSTAARYPYPASPQLQQQQNQPVIGQVQVSAQRYGPVGGGGGGGAPVYSGSHHRDYRPHQRITLLQPDYATSGRGVREGMQQGCGGVVHHIDGGGVAQGQQPIKKIRLQEHRDNIQPLRIDTREQPGTYNPQTEAISPILPDISQQEDQAFRSTKDELLQQIAKVDREIAKAESQISILKKKQQELEEIANKPSVKSEVEEDAQPRHQSLPQKIYAENRKKAQSAHAKLDTLGPKVEWPLYNQPSDTAVYHENKRKHMAFKKRLLEYFKKRHAEKDSRNAYLTETYSKLMQEWSRKVDKVESSAKRKAKEAKNREFFEKVFPELRKQREDKERFNRVGARVKSEADMEEIMDNLQEQAMEDKKMRSYAVIPPILFDARDRDVTYQNDNGFVEDMEMVYKSRQFLNIWTASEKELFKEKYLQHPKNFGVIASFIERKSVADCVQYYYLSKKTENYKQLLRKSRQRTRSSRNNTQKVNSSANTSVVDILTTGVTTRLQREQQQKTVGQQPRDQSSSSEQQQQQQQQAPPTSSSSSSVPSSATAVPAPSTPPATSPSGVVMTTSIMTTTTMTSSSTPQPVPSTCSPVTAEPVTAASVISGSPPVTMATAASVVTTSSGGGGGGQPPSPKPGDNATITIKSEKTTTFSDFNSFEDFRRHQAVKFFGEDAKDGGGGGVATASVDAIATSQEDGGVVVKKEPEATSVQQEVAVSGGEQNNSSGGNTFAGAIAENKKKKERRKDKENTVESSDDDAVEIQDKSNQGNCAVCDAPLGPQLQSRPLAPAQAAQYGLREDQVAPLGRVCNTCRCKCVRSRHTHCPLPTCPNARGRVKRLRSLPQRLHDLSPEVREPLLVELRVPSGCTKCCSACFNRIQRRLGPVEEWTEDEVARLRSGLTDGGPNWQAIGERLGKAPHQVRAFYAANRKRLNLEACLGDRKPTLTDEEESGSSTSSCEESGGNGTSGGGSGVVVMGMMRDRHSSDTTSAAESPPVSQNPNGSSINQIKKEDYDSSATETADEAQTPDHYQGSATITPVTNDGQPRQNASPLSVKDLVLNVIEFSLMKNNPGVAAQMQQQQAPPTGGMAPTISSILNNDSNEVTIVREYTLNPAQQNAQRNDLSFTKLMTPLIGATITPVPPQTQPQPQTQDGIAGQHQNARDDLVILSVQDGREPETLDLSIKKPREPSQPSVVMGNKQQTQQHRDPYLAYHQQQQERKSPFVRSNQQAKLPSPKPANPKSGSITLGTPIINQTRYDGLLRQMTPETKMGSITQGTPIHMPQHVQDKRVYDYYGKRGPPPPNNQQQSQQVQVAPPGGGYGQYRQPTYTVEQQLSRQVIMSDYITSQQMLSRRGGGGEKGYYPGNSPHRTPPPQLSSAQVQQQANQQRQGVIQRHTRPQYLPPGHEALSSLVDVAVQQPSLPVPNQQQQQQQQQPHEGLGKTMADNIMEQPHRLQMIQQQISQQQFRQHQRIEDQRRAYQQQQQQQMSQQQRQNQQQQQQQQRGDSSTLTAASLIDAIITHQINQTAEGGGRGEVVTNAREPRGSDLLFQSFHRDPPPPPRPPSGNDNNGERSPPGNAPQQQPSVISIDLDSDQIGKNLTVKELTESVISHDFNTRPSIGNYGYHQNHPIQQDASEWKRRLQQQHQHQQQKEDKRAVTPQQPQQDERQIIRYHVEPVSPPDNHWSGGDNYRRYHHQQQQAQQQQQQQQQQHQSQNQHISPLDYMKNRIVEVMLTEDDNKKEDCHQHQDKERSDSPGEMVIDEEKHDDFNNQKQVPLPQQQQQQQQQQGFGGYYGLKASTANDSLRNNEPKPLLSSQYEPLSDED